MRCSLWMNVINLRWIVIVFVVFVVSVNIIARNRWVKGQLKSNVSKINCKKQTKDRRKEEKKMRTKKRKENSDENIFWNAIRCLNFQVRCSKCMSTRSQWNKMGQQCSDWEWKASFGSHPIHWKRERRWLNGKETMAKTEQHENQPEH